MIRMGSRVYFFMHQNVPGIKAVDNLTENRSRIVAYTVPSESLQDFTVKAKTQLQLATMSCHVPLT